MSKKSRSVLVTGASGSLGAAIARDLAIEGFAVTLHYCANLNAVETLAEEIKAKGGQVRVLQFDQTDRIQTRTRLEADIEEHGAYYGIVCNAGKHRDGPFPGMPDEDWDQVLDVNLDGFFNVVRPLVLPMIQLRDGGRIVTMSSISGMMGNRGQVNYSAAKAGLIGATKALAVELAKRRITVNCVAPGVIESEMIEGVQRDFIMKSIPMQRFGTPEEVSSLVRFLFSTSASYITRQVISVNGGFL